MGREGGGEESNSQASSKIEFDEHLNWPTGYCIARLRRLSGCSADFAMQERKKRFDVGNQKREAEEARETQRGRGEMGYGKREIMSSKRTCGVDRRLCPLAVDSAMRSWFARMYLIVREGARESCGLARASERASEQLRASFSNQGEWCSQNGRPTGPVQRNAVATRNQYARAIYLYTCARRGPAGRERPIRDPGFHAWLRSREGMRNLMLRVETAINRIS